MCTRCKQRVAVIFVNHVENDHPVSDGLCLQCAREIGIPQLQGLMDKLGITEEDIDSLSDQVMELLSGEEGFKPGGAMPFPAFMMGNMPVAQPPKDEPPEIIEPAPRIKEEKKPKNEHKKRKFLDAYCENLTGKAADDLSRGHSEKLSQALGYLLFRDITHLRGWKV